MFEIASIKRKRDIANQIDGLTIDGRHILMSFNNVVRWRQNGFKKAPTESQINQQSQLLMLYAVL